MKKIKNGFTLIELLVVVLIIGILAAVALPSYQRAVLKSRFVQTQIAARALYDAVERAYLTNGEYPADLTALDIEFGGTLSSSNKNITYKEVECSYYYGNSGTGDSIICKISSPFVVGTRYFIGKSNRTGRYCLSYDDKGEEFCRSLGGVNRFESGSAIHYKY